MELLIKVNGRGKLHIEEHDMELNFEWDESKAKLNIKNHPGVSFEEAKNV